MAGYDRRPTWAALVAACLLLGLVIALYGRRLADAPPYLAHDEIKFALQAQAITTTGRDLNGALLPLYFSEPEFRGGRDPMSIYATALALKFLPLSETSIRLPTVIVGILDVVLMFLVARRLFSNDWFAVMAAGLIALTPAHFIHARFGLDVLYPLPFVLGWLLCLSMFLERDRIAWLIAGAFCLGIGVYSYLPAIVMMPAFVLFTCLAVRRRGNRARLWTWATLGFVVSLLPLVAWQVTHPTRYADLIAAYQTPGTAPPRSTSAAILDAADTYWNFFNPGFLFFTGDSSLINSTRGVGVFLLPVAALLLCGIYRIATVRRSALALILLAGLVLVPLAPATMGVVEIRRALVIVPFAILIAAFGAEQLWLSGRRVDRLVLVALLVLALAQYRSFYTDYFGAHRVRSAIWLGGNVRGAVTDAISEARRQRAPAIYLSQAIPYIDAYWRFYALATNAGEIQSAAVYYDARTLDVGSVPAGALRVTDVAEAAQSGHSASWEPVRTIRELDDAPSFVLSRRR